VRLTTLLILTVTLYLFVSPTFAVEQWQLTETRLCGPPKRNADGVIIRSAAVRAAFRKLWACPSTQKFDGPCPEWEMDHIIPLAQCGCDAVFNMQWLPIAIKTCATATGIPCKDRFEQSVYATGCGSFPK